MAIEFTQRGNISLENRLAYFKGGSPVNPKEWNALKKQLSMSFLAPTAISFDMVNRTFNPVKDGWSDMTLRTSREQFIGFCHENYILCKEDYKNGVFICKAGLPKNGL